MSTKNAKTDTDLSTTPVDEIALPFIRTAYDGSHLAASSASVLHFDPDVMPSMTKQSFVDECDINNILDTFTRTGILTSENTKSPHYFDNTNVPDYRDALNLAIDAHNAFADLPAKVRERFHNDPEKLLEFVSDDTNYAEAVKLGLIPPPPEAQDVTDVPNAPVSGGDPNPPVAAS